MIKTNLYRSHPSIGSYPHTSQKASSQQTKLIESAEANEPLVLDESVHWYPETDLFLFRWFENRYCQWCGYVAEVV